MWHQGYTEDIINKVTTESEWKQLLFVYKETPQPTLTFHQPFWTENSFQWKQTTNRHKISQKKNNFKQQMEAQIQQRNLRMHTCGLKRGWYEKASLCWFISNDNQLLYQTSESQELWTALMLKGFLHRLTFKLELIHLKVVSVTSWCGHCLLWRAGSDHVFTQKAGLKYSHNAMPEDKK